MGIGYRMEGGEESMGEVKKKIGGGIWRYFEIEEGGVCEGGRLGKWIGR